MTSVTLIVGYTDYWKEERIRKGFCKCEWETR